ncbi:MAG: cytochrome c [Ignavibacteria bacterium]|nr:cytochrome c [Ignavibacteria bacterium]
MKKVTAFIVMVGCVVLFSSMSAQDKAAQMKRGAVVYNEYCKTCHQANGKGLGAAFPPLAKSDYLKSMPKATIIKEVLMGKTGKVKVNGKEYNGVMAPLPAKYTAEDAASVLTYVYNSFGNSGTTVTAAEVKKIDKKRK